MQTQNIQPSPETILQVGTGFWPSKTLLTAIGLQLFTILAEEKSLSAKNIKNKLGFGCTERNVFDFLDTLTGLGFLQREGILETAVYSNSIDADFFLDKKKPAYIGGILEMMNSRLYGFWGDLEEGLKTGKAQNESKNGGAPLFVELYKSREKLEAFANAMTGLQVINFITFAEKFDFKGYIKLTDVGGAAAMLSVQVAKHHRHMHCISFDLPPVEPIAQNTIKKFELTDRVSTASGDFFNDPIPVADVIVMGNILHDWDEEQKLALMKKAHASLTDGGAFVAIENIIDEDRKENVFGLLMSLNMLIETGTGFDYTFSDFNRWAKAAGFISTEVIPLTGPSSAVVAYK